MWFFLFQMGSNMRPTIFNDRVATALKNWHHSAKKNMKQHRNPDSTSPFSSRPTTPTHGMSPIHLLHKHQHGSTSPRLSDAEPDQWEELPPSSHHNRAHDNQDQQEQSETSREQEMTVQRPSSSETGSITRPARPHQEITRSPSDFSFAKWFSNGRWDHPDQIFLHVFHVQGSSKYYICIIFIHSRTIWSTTS